MRGIHGHRWRGGRSRTYSSWENMISRCTYKRSPSYPNYGGRGISVCTRWLDFTSFLEDIGERPDNCKWSTRKEQSNNRRNNTLIEIDGVTKTITEWTRHFNVSMSTVMGRKQRGVSGIELFRKVG